jgi:hypothetical protein
MMSKGRAFEQNSFARGNGGDGCCFALSGGDKVGVDGKLSYLALRNRWKKRRGWKDLKRLAGQMWW